MATTYSIGNINFKEVVMNKLGAQTGNARSEAENQLLQAVNGVRYGSVEITIHDSRIVQIERKEKVRFDADGNGKQ